MLAALMGTVTEIMQYVLNRGASCYDDMLSYDEISKDHFEE